MIYRTTTPISGTIDRTFRPIPGTPRYFAARAGLLREFEDYPENAALKKRIFISSVCGMSRFSRSFQIPVTTPLSTYVVLENRRQPGQAHPHPVRTVMLTKRLHTDRIPPPTDSPMITHSIHSTIRGLKTPSPSSLRSRL
jgi:hypothetical protein